MDKCRNKIAESRELLPQFGLNQSKLVFAVIAVKLNFVVFRLVIAPIIVPYVAISEKNDVFSSEQSQRTLKMPSSSCNFFFRRCKRQEHETVMFLI